MWDVKNSQPMNHSGFKSWFYLNYVGCKDFSAVIALAAIFGFTLTMWDVKGNILDSILRKVEVLP